ncbi:endonuclease III domain-containing protein [Chloroflexota bacterium]
MKKRHIEQVFELLVKEYGYRQWQSRSDPVSELIQTILSQNTSDVNSHRAFVSLVSSFPDWKAIAQAGIKDISASIRSGGLADVKAKYIKQALEYIYQKHGDLELEFLKQLSMEEARDWLMQIPGVGIKTASCVLLFSLCMPSFPVDTHVFRVAKKLGLLDSKISVDQAHRLLEKMVPVNDIFTFHITLIEHGRKICKAQRPHCHDCIMQQICPGRENQAELKNKTT